MVVSGGGAGTERDGRGGCGGRRDKEGSLSTEWSDMVVDGRHDEEAR
jgi:hypothetical protein